MERQMGYWLVIAIGITGGLAVGLQAQIAGSMGQRVGGIASSFIIHFSGMVFSAVYLWMRGGERIGQWYTLPWYMLGAGIFGLILYLSINVTMPRLGSTAMITLILTGQLLMGLLIDQYGLLGASVRQIDVSRGIGLLSLVIGAYLIAR